MKIKLALLFLLVSVGAFAQTAVTATITDSDSQTWNNGTWTASLVSPSGPPQGCTTATTVAGTMSGSGVITGSLCDNSLVGPSGSTWRFTICPNASANCSQVSTAVSGSTQNLSSVLSAGVTAPRFPATFGAHGYLDVEVSPTPQPGMTYYNVTTPAFRQWTGSAWASVGGGGGSGTIATTPNVLKGDNAGNAVASSATDSGLFSSTNAFATSGSAANATSTTEMDFNSSSGTGRILAFGANSSTAGGLQFYGLSNNSSVVNLLLNFSPSGGMQLPFQHSVTGTRFLCVDSAGNVTASATACVGT
jgi:hypothetical protein